MDSAERQRRRSRPSGHRISSSCDPNRQNHSSGPISQSGHRFGPTESARMVAFAPTSSPSTTTGPTHPAPRHSATPQRISTLDKLEAPAPHVGSPTTIRATNRLGFLNCHASMETSMPAWVAMPAWIWPCWHGGHASMAWRHATMASHATMV